MAEQQKYDFTYEGKVVEIGGVQTFGSGFKKRLLVIDNTPEGKDWKNPVPFYFTKDDVAKLDGIKKGMTVRVGGYFNGRRWDGPKGTQYFCDNTVYGKVEIVGGSANAPTAAEPEPSYQSDNGEIAEDMPF